MKLQLAWKNYSPSDAEKELVEERLSSLDGLLGGFEEDLKLADVRIERRSRWGFEVRFDMQLPEKHVFSKSANADLTLALVSVREEAERQIKEYLDKARGSY